MSKSRTVVSPELAWIYTVSGAGIGAFVLTVSEGSYARAARCLGLHRSAVSRRVHALERQLGVQLIASSQRMGLTPEGLRFYRRCRPGIEDIAHALALWPPDRARADLP